MLVLPWLTIVPFLDAMAAERYRVALIFTTSPVSEMEGNNPEHPSARAFVHELRSLGYQEGRNLVLERRSANGRFERFRQIISELIAQPIDAIVTVGDDMALIAKQVTQTVPIVATVYSDPVQTGLVASLARPGGNITGVVVTAGPEIEGKRLQFMREALPQLRRVAFLGLSADWDTEFGKSIRAAAQGYGLTLSHAVHTPTSYDSAFEAILRGRPDAVIVANTPANMANRRLIVDFMLRAHLPVMYSRREYTEAGGLMSYGTNVPDILRRAAYYVDKIIKGTSPGELPIEQPSKFELVVNVGTARALGITIPSSLLIRADQLIE
jgi:putative ABC transport system substrate-binding protein